MYVAHYLQAGSELTGFAWDSSAHEYVRSESVGAQLVALMQLAALCRLVSAGPVVQCLPAAASARSQRVQLQLQLTVPSHSRLLGWQPAGSAVSAEAEALTLSSDVPQLDVLVLVRRAGGAYLPVTLSLLPDSQTPTAGSETWAVCVQVSRHRTETCTRSHPTCNRIAWLRTACNLDMLTRVSSSLQAEVEVQCQDATGLSVEMWAKVGAVLCICLMLACLCVSTLGLVLCAVCRESCSCISCARRRQPVLKPHQAAGLSCWWPTRLSCSSQPSSSQPQLSSCSWRSPWVVCRPSRTCKRRAIAQQTRQGSQMPVGLWVTWVHGCPTRQMPAGPHGRTLSLQTAWHLLAQMCWCILCGMGVLSLHS